MRAMSDVAGPPERTGTAAGMEPPRATNAWGDLARADWRFLLPRLGFQAVLFVGTPRPAVLAALSPTARLIVVAGNDTMKMQELRRVVRKRGCQNVHFVQVENPSRLPCGNSCFELVVFPAEGEMVAGAASGETISELDRVLTRGGTIYLETLRPSDAFRLHRWSEQFSKQSFASPLGVACLRRKGHMQMAIPLADLPRANYFFDHVLYGVSARARLLAQIGRYASRFGLLRYLVSGRALIVERAEAGDAPPPVAPYLAELGQRNGVDLTNHRPVFFARGSYDSNKVAFFLFKRSASAPEFLVKLTRSPEYNDRLETEHRALSLLRERSYVDAGTYPEAVFLDRQQELAVLAEGIVHGAPFRTRTTSRADCPFARDAIDWIIRLGGASADRGEDLYRGFAAGMEQLFDQFHRTYPLSDTEDRFLEEQIAVLCRADGDLPLVFRHADAGTWNVLVGEDGRAIFLDWELSEPQGPPLWDLLTFVRSFAIWIARGRGQKDSTAGYSTVLLDDTPLSRLQTESIRRYVAAVELDRSFLEPLFYSCWMQRAVREAAWTSAPPERGSYFRLLKLCIRRRNAPGLRWLIT